MRSCAAWLVFPAIAGGAVAGTAAMDRGLAPVVAALLAQLGAVIAVMVAEQLVPHHPEPIVGMSLRSGRNQ